MGILAAAYKEGKVNAALYAKPHFMSENDVVSLMDERLTYENLKNNPNAAYLFVEAGSVNQGQRVYLTRQRGEEEPEFIDSSTHAS